MKTEEQQDLDLGAKSKILSRIKKMLALANDAGASEGERDNALRMVQTILTKHNLSMAEAESHGAVAEEKRMEGTFTMVGHRWSRVLVNAIAQLYFCNYFTMKLSGGKVINYVIGREGNVATVREMSEYIIRSISREASRRQRELFEDGGWHRSFCNGAANKIYWRCDALRKEAVAAPTEKSTTGTAIVLASFYQMEKAANDKLMADRGHVLTDRKSGGAISAHAAAYNAGSQYGSNVSLHRGLADNRIKGQLK